MNILSISRQTLSNYVKQGLVKIDTTINGKYRYNKESVFNLLEGDN
jgi:predicted site-specific integrase-resolvase